MTKCEKVEFDRGYPLAKPKWSNCRLWRLISEFAESGLAKKKIDSSGYKKPFVGRASISFAINKYGLEHIKCKQVGDDLYLINTMVEGKKK